jgi:hypothetical protein
MRRPSVDAKQSKPGTCGATSRNRRRRKKNDASGADVDKIINGTDVIDEHRRHLKAAYPSCKQVRYLYGGRQLFVAASRRHLLNYASAHANISGADKAHKRRAVVD